MSIARSRCSRITKVRLRINPSAALLRHIHGRCHECAFLGHWAQNAMKDRVGVSCGAAAVQASAVCSLLESSSACPWQHRVGGAQMRSDVEKRPATRKGPYRARRSTSRRGLTKRQGRASDARRKPGWRTGHSAAGSALDCADDLVSTHFLVAFPCSFVVTGLRDCKN